MTGFVLNTEINKGGWLRLAPGAKKKKKSRQLVVKRDLQPFNGDSFINTQQLHAYIFWLQHTMQRKIK